LDQTGALRNAAVAYSFEVLMQCVFVKVASASASASGGVAAVVAGVAVGIAAGVAVVAAGLSTHQVHLDQPFRTCNAADYYRYY